MAEPVKLATVLWRRLDASGSDVAHLWRNDDGWSVTGTAVFLQDERIADLRYEVRCDAAWETRRGSVTGWVGERVLQLEIAVDAERRWRVNGKPVEGVTGCIDLDLNFTPATNLIQFRRLALPLGVRVEAPAAWLKVPEFELRRLPQFLERTRATSYDYAAPTEGYAGELNVDESGFVRTYPGLWAAEAVERFGEGGR